MPQKLTDAFQGHPTGQQCYRECVAEPVAVAVFDFGVCEYRSQPFAPHRHGEAGLRRDWLSPVSITQFLFCGIMNLSIDIREVPEDKRNTKFEEDLSNFQVYVKREFKNPRWLFRVALHEGSHLHQARKSGEEFTLRGPHMQYRNGKCETLSGSIEFFVKHPDIYDYEYIMDCLRFWLAGPYAVTVLTGEVADPEADIQRACEHLKISRDKIESFLWVAEDDLQLEFENSKVVEKILDAARAYANAIFHDDSCVDWGIKWISSRLAG